MGQLMRLIMLGMAVGLTPAIRGGVTCAADGPRGLEIYWVDVEGGAATLIVTPAGESVLIDSGNPGRRDPDRIVRVATEAAGLRRIDHLITTHFHVDHFGGAESLAALLPIQAVYDNGVFDGMPDHPGKAYFEFATGRRVILKPGDRLPLKQTPGTAPVALTCIGGRQNFIAARDDMPENSQLCANARRKERDGSDNANSLVVVLDFGPFRFFDAGDLTWNQEERLVCPKNLIGEVDVYQVTHHGLDASNNPLVLRALRPTVAIMNNGVTKGCAPEVFTNLKETSSLEAIFQVHKNLRPDGTKNNVPDEFIANLNKECDGNPIRLAVEPDGAKYVVSIPATGKSASFASRPNKTWGAYPAAN